MFTSEFHSTEKPTVALRYKDFLIEINQVYFTTKLNELIEELYETPDDFNVQEHDYLFRKLIKICGQCRSVFQHCYHHIARKMIEYHFPPEIQHFLDQFLMAIKASKSKEEFIELYAKDSKLHGIIELFQLESLDNEGQILIENLLRTMRESHFEVFVIAVTHFNNYKHLLDNKKMI